MTSAAQIARKPRRPSLLVTAASAACVFLVVVTFLALQLHAGHDPALGTIASSVPPAQVSAPAAGHSTRGLVTRSSGGTGVVSRPVRQAAPAKSKHVAAPVTRSSGG